MTCVTQALDYNQFVFKSIIQSKTLLTYCGGGHDLEPVSKARTISSQTLVRF